MIMSGTGNNLAARILLIVSVLSCSGRINRTESFPVSSSNDGRRPFRKNTSSSLILQAASSSSSRSSSTRQVPHSTEQQDRTRALFDDFVDFLIQQQTKIIDEIESTIEKCSNTRFSRDTWGCFDDKTKEASTNSGGITRVLQGGDCIEKGACSLTVIGNGILSAERAATIRARQSVRDAGEPQEHPPLQIRAGDTYSAAALSMVLHSKSPLVPTFRSDVRVFLVTDQETQESAAWLGESLCVDYGEMWMKTTDGVFFLVDFLCVALAWLYQVEALT